MKRCTRCKNRWFCSRECQVLDWKTHRDHCFLSEHYLQSPKRIKVLHNKETLTVLLCEQLSGKRIMQEISEQLRIPMYKLKIVCRGKILTENNCHHHIFVKKVNKFMAFGEQREVETDLSCQDINHIVDKTRVARNQAIRALRQCKGNVVDAILMVG